MPHNRIVVDSGAVLNPRQQLQHVCCSCSLCCSRIIVDSEVNTGAWTLMHRFNKATDLLGDVMQARLLL